MSRQIPRTLLLALLLSASAQAQVIIHVDDDAPAGGFGQNWNSAFQHLNDALAMSPPGAEVRVAQGTYYADRGASQVAGDRTATFQLPPSVNLRGGYRGLSGGGSPDDRDVAAFPTFLSGDLMQNDPVTTDNTNRIVTMTGIGLATVDGFSIDASAGGLLGGGVYKVGGNLTLIDCTFSLHSTTSAYLRAGSNNELIRCTFTNTQNGNTGRGLEALNATVAITDSSFIGNYGGCCSGGGLLANNSTLDVRGTTFRRAGSAEGGGVFVRNSVLKLVGCAVEECVATAGAGGGVYIWDSDMDASDTTFLSNEASRGGAIYMHNDSSLLATDCLFLENWAGSGSGGAVLASGFATGFTLIGCTFDRNHSGSAGGAVRLAKGTVRECTFVENDANSSGGGLYVEDGNGFTATVQDCLFEDNYSNHDGGGLGFTGSDGQVLNVLDCRFVDNRARHGGGLAAAALFGTVTLIASRCELVGNSAFGMGGGMLLDGLSLQLSSTVVAANALDPGSEDGGGAKITSVDGSIARCTFTANQVDVAQGAGLRVVMAPGETLDLRDSIVWGNTGSGAPALEEQLSVEGAGFTYEYSDVGHSTGGIGNIDLDPLFVDPLVHNYSLALGSPCIDAGDPLSVLDPDGTRADMGGLPHDQNACPPYEVYCQTSPNAFGDGALVGATGSLDLGANDLSLTVVRATPDNFGIFFYGRESSATPVGNGVLCIGTGSGGFFRLPVVALDSEGGGAFPVDFTSFPMNAGPGQVVPGVAFHFQFWYRDPGGPGPTDYNFSNALRILFCP